MQGRLAILAFVGLFAACAQEPAVPPTHPNILVVTIDTLRADRLTPHHMPALSELAARGAFFRRARSVVPLTLPAHVSIMTGLEPPSHGVRENGVHRFSGQPPPLAVRLRERGYATAAFVGAFVLDRRFGLDAGFDAYDDQVPRDPAATEVLEAERPGDRVVDRALGWLDTQRPGLTPYFLWVHLYDPHAPYTPPSDFLARAGADPYDGEVRFADAQVARLLSAVDRRRERDRTLVIVVGDHGESLGEHGEATHGILLYDAALRVPLVVAGPGIRPAVRDDPASVIDVAPIALARAGAEWSGMAGVDLVSGPAEADRELYAETDYPRVGGWRPLRSLVQDRWKVIVSDETELYDLDTDPAEQRNVAAGRASTARAMAARLAGRSIPAAPPTPAPSPDAAERLRALGYVASSAPPPAQGAGANPARHIAGWVRFEEALSLLAHRQPRRAEPALRGLALEFPDAPIFHATWARSLADAGQPKRALDVYRGLVRRWTDDAVLFHDLAVAAREAGEADEARRAEEASLALDPRQAAPHNGLGLLQADAGRHADARTAFAEAVRLDPTNTTFRVNLGNACRALGDLDEAETAYRAALEREPRAPDALNGLAVALVQQGRARDAVPLLEQALQADRGFVEARLNLGIAFQESGDRVRAAEQYRAVLRAPAHFARERNAAAALLKGIGR
jgi:arylsulfatase A-like enzyme/Flp pilus assembly protein TadD